MPNGSLDRLDKAILRELQQDSGRTTNDIADKVGLSQSPCWKRIKAMEESGVIRGQVAVLDRFKIGLPALAYIRTRLDRSVADSLDGFERFARDTPEIIRCDTVLGDSDFILLVAAADMAGFEEILRRIWALGCMKEVTTHVVLKESKPFEGYPVV
jgi:Lrp/AsnC family transcriptional regulator